MLDKTKVREIALEYAHKVIQAYDPKSVILFGSYVNGVPHQYSDIDIAIVFDGYEGNWLETWTELCKLRRNISLDIEPHMMDETNDRSGFLEHVKKTGEIVYEA
jgi:predicted nucleotidyltransferase